MNWAEAQVVGEEASRFKSLVYDVALVPVVWTGYIETPGHGQAVKCVPTQTSFDLQL